MAMAQHTKDQQRYKCEKYSLHCIPRSPPPLLIGIHCDQFLVYPFGDIVCVLCKELCTSLFLIHKWWLV